MVSWFSKVENMPYFYNTISIIGLKLNENTTNGNYRAVVVLVILVYGTILFHLHSAVRPFL